MIIEFSTGNNFSFKDTVTLSMVAANISPKDKNLNETNLIKVNESLSLLKSAAIYGANASGKSNLIKAMNFMRFFVRYSHKIEDYISVNNFRLSEDSLNQPTLFQMIFLLNGKRYRYGFEVNNERVVTEWLFHVPRKIEAKLFIREGDEISFSTRTFKEGKGLKSKTRPDTLFLTTVGQFNGEISKSIINWFKMLRIYSGGLKDMKNYDYTASLLRKPQYKYDIVNLIKKFDLDIEDIEVEKRAMSLPDFSSPPEDVPEKLKEATSKLSVVLDEVLDIIPMPDISVAKTYHQKYDEGGKRTSMEVFSLDAEESDGTVKLFTLAGSLVDVLGKGKVLIIDELDIRLHPLITRAIVQLFNSNESNPNNAQLIFTTHDTNILKKELFRRDQIWFTEKDHYGASHLYSLAEYKVRNDSLYDRDYISGKYGAIPFVGDLEQLVGGEDE